MFDAHKYLMNNKFKLSAANGTPPYIHINWTKSVAARILMWCKSMHFIHRIKHEIYSKIPIQGVELNKVVQIKPIFRNQCNAFTDLYQFNWFSLQAHARINLCGSLFTLSRSKTSLNVYVLFNPCKNWWFITCNFRLSANYVGNANEHSSLDRILLIRRLKMPSVRPYEAIFYVSVYLTWK